MRDLEDLSPADAVEADFIDLDEEKQFAVQLSEGECASCAVPCTAGVIAAPAAVVVGCTENTSCVAVPAVMLNAALVALPAPVAVSV